MFEKLENDSRLPENKTIEIYKNYTRSHDKLLSVFREKGLLLSENGDSDYHLELLLLKPFLFEKGEYHDCVLNTQFYPSFFQDGFITLSTWGNIIHHSNFLTKEPIIPFILKYKDKYSYCIMRDINNENFMIERALDLTENSICHTDFALVEEITYPNTKSEIKKSFSMWLYVAAATLAFIVFKSYL